MMILLHLLVISFFHHVEIYFLKHNISDILFTYIIGKTYSFKKLNLKNHDFRICVELPIKAKRMNYNYTTLPSYERSRIGGKKRLMQ